MVTEAELLRVVAPGRKSGWMRYPTLLHTEIYQLSTIASQVTPKVATKLQIWDYTVILSLI